MNATLSLAACVLLATAIDAATVQPPDPRQGKIDGLQAIIVYAYEERGAKDEILSPDGCTAHFADEAGNETVKPCGDWFILPAAGRYVMWVETADAISTRQTLFIYRPTPFGGSGMTMMHAVVPAGAVALRAAGDGGDTVRVLSVDRTFQRRLSRRVLPAKVRFPAGEAIAGTFDAQGNALALSRPVAVTAGRTVEIVPAPPARGSDVVAILSRAPGSPVAAPAKLSLLIDKREPRKPDVFFATQNTFYGFWYGLDESHATLRVDSASMALDDTSVQLKPNAVATVRTRLRTK